MAPPSPAVRIASLFRGLSRAHGVYQLPPGRTTTKRKAGGNKLEGKAHTVQEPVTVALWERHLQGKQGLGIVPIMDDAACWFGAIDVDQYDVKIEELEAQCATLGLPLLPTRTKSGGVHLYVFFKEPVPAKLVRARLGEWAILVGYGGSEIFPKQDELLNGQDTGNWINMPYFEAAATERYGILNGKPLDLEAYCDRAELLRITEEQLEALDVGDAGEDFVEAPPCLQSLARSGFGEGMRNNGLFAVAVYLKKRYPDDWKAHLYSYNATYMRPPLGEGEVKTLTKTISRKDYNYTCSKPPLKAFCNRGLCRTREFGIGEAHGDWGITIDSDVQKVATDPPYWLATVNGVRVKLFSDDLMNQRSFQRICLERVGLLPVPLPADTWRAEVNKLLKTATVVEAPQDASVAGELGYHLKQFCTVYPQAETREEVLVGKPFTEEGVTHFRAADFKKYLDAQHFRALNGHRLYAELRTLGLTHKQFWVSDQNITVWTVAAYTQSEAEVPVRHPKQEAGEM